MDQWLLDLYEQQRVEPGDPSKAEGPDKEAHLVNGIRSPEKYMSISGKSASPLANEWQTGLCDAYAVAMLQEHPHLRLGVAGTTFEDGGWWPQHFFAHDDTHAYDSLGKHPLPYHGSQNQFDHVDLDQTPEAWGLPENGTPEDVERARAIIRSRSHFSSKKYAISDDLEDWHEPSQEAAPEIHGKLPRMPQPGHWRALKVNDLYHVFGGSNHMEYPVQENIPFEDIQEVFYHSDGKWKTVHDPNGYYKSMYDRLQQEKSRSPKEGGTSPILNWKVVEGTRNEHQDGRDRRPIIMHPENKTIYVGPSGSAHYDIQHEFAKDLGMVRGMAPKGLEYGAWHPTSGMVVDYTNRFDTEIASQLLGAKPIRPEEDWSRISYKLPSSPEEWHNFNPNEEFESENAEQIHALLGVTDAEDEWGESHKSASLPEVIEEGGGDEVGEHGRPFVYHPGDQTVYLGDEGTGHYSLPMPDDGISGRIKNNTVRFFGEGQSEIVEALKHHTGQPLQSEALDWKTSSELPEVKLVNSTRTPGYYGWRRPFTYRPDTNIIRLGTPGAYHDDLGNDAWHDNAINGYVSIGGEQFGQEVPKGLGWFWEEGRQPAIDLPEYHQIVQQALIPHEPAAAFNMPIDDDEWGAHSPPILGSHKAASEYKVIPPPDPYWSNPGAEEENYGMGDIGYGWRVPLLIDHAKNVYLGKHGDYHYGVGQAHGLTRPVTSPNYEPTKQMTFGWIVDRNRWADHYGEHNGPENIGGVEVYGEKHDKGAVAEALKPYFPNAHPLDSEVKDDWDFATGSYKASTVPVYHGTSTETGGGPEESMHGARNPVIYQSQGEKAGIYVGAPGAYHKDLETEFGLNGFSRGAYRGGIRPGNGGHLFWYFGVPENHEDLAEQLGVAPEPRAGSDEDDWENFHSSSMPPHSVLFSQRTVPRHEMFSETRQPIIHELDNNRTYVGPLGGYHDDLWHEFKIPLGGRWTKGALTEGRLHWFGTMPSNSQEIAQSLGAESTSDAGQIDDHWSKTAAIDPNEWTVLQHQYGEDHAQSKRIPVIVDAPAKTVHVGEQGTLHSGLMNAIDPSIASDRKRMQSLDPAYIFRHDAPHDNSVYKGVGNFIRGIREPFSNEDLVGLLNHHADKWNNDGPLVTTQKRSDEEDERDEWEGHSYAHRTSAMRVHDWREHDMDTQGWGSSERHPVLADDKNIFIGPYGMHHYPFELGLREAGEMVPNWMGHHVLLPPGKNYKEWQIMSFGQDRSQELAEALTKGLGHSVIPYSIDNENWETVSSMKYPQIIPIKEEANPSFRNGYHSDDRPFIYNRGRNALYLGANGQFHNDLINDLPEEHQDAARMSNDAMGRVDDQGEMEYYYGLGLHDELADPLSKYLGADARYYNDGDDWDEHPSEEPSSRSASAPFEVVPSQHTRDVGSNDLFSVRRPLVFDREQGKIFLGQPGVYHDDVKREHNLPSWPSFDGYIITDSGRVNGIGRELIQGLHWYGQEPKEHSEIQKALVPFEPAAAEDGTVSEDWGDHHVGHITINRVPEVNGPVHPGGPPVIYEGRKNTLHIGPAGAYHSYLSGRVGIDTWDNDNISGRLLKNEQGDPYLYWYGAKPQNHEEISQMLGIPASSSDEGFGAWDDQARPSGSKEAWEWQGKTASYTVHPVDTWVGATPGDANDWGHPFIAENGAIHLGPLGGYHEEIQTKMFNQGKKTWDDSAWHGRVYPNGRIISYQGRGKAELPSVADALSQHLGYPVAPRPGDEWGGHESAFNAWQERGPSEDHPQGALWKPGEHWEIVDDVENRVLPGPLKQIVDQVHPNGITLSVSGTKKNRLGIKNRRPVIYSPVADKLWLGNERMYHSDVRGEFPELNKFHDLHEGFISLDKANPYDGAGAGLDWYGTGRAQDRPEPEAERRIIEALLPYEPAVADTLVNRVDTTDEWGDHYGSWHWSEQMQLFDAPGKIQRRRGTENSWSDMPWRVPYIYDAHDRILYEGPKAAFHSDVSNEFDLPIRDWGDGGNRYITGYRNLSRGQPYAKIGWFRHNPHSDEIARLLRVNPAVVDNPSRDGDDYDEDEWGVTSKTSKKLWRPGTWGKGLFLDGELHTWPTWYKGAAPYHADILNGLGVPNKDQAPGRVMNPIWISPEGKAEASKTWGPEYWDWHLENEITRQEPAIHSVFEDPFFDDPDFAENWQDEKEGPTKVNNPGYEDNGMPRWVKEFGLKR